MIKLIRTSKATRVIACYLALMLMLQVAAPMQAYALTGGPAQPEFNSFTPIGTSDMVDLASGDFNYNIPVMDIGGYPINLAYNSGVTMDQEASWVGLGWDLNVGQIARQLRGLPDDFDGDQMVYENNMKDNVTVGANFNIFATAFGIKEAKASVGLGVKYNNYDGFGFSVNGGLTYQISDNLSVGMSMNSSASEGVSVSPTISMHGKYQDNSCRENKLTGSLGTTLNSRKGVENVTMSASRSRVDKAAATKDDKDETSDFSQGGSISFIDASFTPTKRVGMISSNYTFSMNLEGEVWGFEPGMKFAGYRTSQGIKDSEKYKTEKAYGFENTYNATDNDVLDFNREKDRTFNQYTTTLPVTNNTYDLYSIQGQGIGGTFRPYKGQVGYVYDNYVNDDTNGGSLGIEIGAGGGVHWGFDASVTTGNSSTKAWRNGNWAIGKFAEKKTGNRPDYEKVFFKNIGGNHVDDELTLLNNKLGGYDPVMFELSGGKFSRNLEARYLRKQVNALNPININGPIKREGRLKRNQAIQKLTRAEVANYGIRNSSGVSRGQFSPYSLSGKHDHHTSEIRVTKDGGERYIYGRAAYNVVKKEVTFDISGRQGDCSEGLVGYVPGSHNTPGNNANGDRYFNRITTPAYAHTYLLTAVLSSDYSDVKDDGLTDDDLGQYTKFTYEDKSQGSTYKWRVPYDENKANYDDGLKSSKKDDKGNYIYGEKELLYISKIETKTHVAVFHISARKDGYGVKGENGGGEAGMASKMYKLDKISLYSKPEYQALGNNATPIKEAHFVYDYSLCKNVKNNFKEAVTQGGNELANQGGKLTLKKVYFSYRNSNMGKYTPYKFNYSLFNPDYDLKAYDTWGNYKPNASNVGCNANDGLPNTEFPFVDQTDRATTDKYATAWLLQSVEMPSGGILDIKYESDDYRYVQNKEVMEMFKVVGVGNDSTSLGTSNKLYAGSLEAKYLYIKLHKHYNPDGTERQVTTNEFEKQYLKHLYDEPVYFRFLLNMVEPGSTDKYDYVTGYLNLDKGLGANVINVAGQGQYAAIPVRFVSKGDGFDENDKVHPVSKAGWFFGRQYLNRLVYSQMNEEDTNNLEGIVMEIIGAIPAILDIFKSPNGKLIQRRIASEFVKDKSWIRLMQPDSRKVGGGSRVAEVKIHDQWQVMTNHNDEEHTQFYGQTYSYDTEENGKIYTSGIATYEPLGNKENPLVQPFYDNKNPGLLLGPDSQNYVEKPLGESFYPSPKVTYGKVTVKNLPRKKVYGQNQTVEVKKNATGKVVTEFFTSYSYPTIADYTPISSKYDKTGPLGSLLNLNVRDHLTMSQGYSIHTNDMDGKMKSQRVYGEGQNDAISGVDYVYEDLTTQTSTNQGKLNNTITTIDSNGNISQKLVGVDYDVINDFRHSESITSTGGLHFNTAGLPIGIFFIVVPTPLPSFSRHENVIKTAVTTKVIHSSGILREKVAYDVGAKVSTKNLAWDAETGEVLLTETANEYDDKYYTFNYPAYWAYTGMEQASLNLGLKSGIKRLTGGTGKYYLTPYGNKASDYLAEGDELWLESSNKPGFKAWVVSINNNDFTLINQQGLYLTQDDINEGTLQVIRSGHRNQQTLGMASVTCMVNPIAGKVKLEDDLFSESAWDKYRIVNASAIEYNDTWKAQCECYLPKMKFNTAGALVFDFTKENEVEAYNPYHYNVKGNWRAKVSYAYLTGRNITADPTPRNTGYFNDFKPFYTYSSNSKNWIVNATNKGRWTYASEVNEYNPFGFEIENKDALDRYSSALYGYNHKFPTAVASNTRYRELAFDGFEDYNFSLCDTTSHFSFNGSIKEHEITISPNQAHSGRKSLKVAPGAKATVKKQIIKCNPAGQQ